MKFAFKTLSHIRPSSSHFVSSSNVFKSFHICLSKERKFQHLMNLETLNEIQCLLFYRPTKFILSHLIFKTSSIFFFSSLFHFSTKMNDDYSSIKILFINNIIENEKCLSHTWTTYKINQVENFSFLSVTSQYLFPWKINCFLTA